MTAAAPTQVEATNLEGFLKDRPRKNILRFMDNLPWFWEAASWKAWRACLCAIYGLPMTKAQLEIFKTCTGRTKAPTRKAREVWLICGRRSRKSAIAALIGVWEGSDQFLGNPDKHLAPGERPWIPILAKNRDDAQQIKRFADNILNDIDWLRKSSKDDEIALNTGVDMVIRAAKIMAGRSRACPLGLLDEVAFFPTDEAAQPDVEILRGIRPGMANIPGALLVAASSPYARRGQLWENYRDHFGKDDDPILVWQADTLTMHDTLQLRAEIATEYEKDPQSAAAEYGALFRTDVEAFITDEAIDAVTMKGVTEIPPGHEHDPPTSHVYFAFVDPAGGMGDSFTWAICHYDLFERVVIHDFSHEIKAPFDAGDAMDAMVTSLKRYRITQVKGDHWGGMWNRNPLRAQGISFVVSERAKSDIYRDVLPILTSKRVKLLDLKRVRLQFTALDRRTGRGGRDSIDHMAGAHDDVCLAAGTLVATTRGLVPIEGVVCGDSVLVPGGTARVLWAGKTGLAPVTVRGTLLATAGHPVFCDGVGFVPFLGADQSQWSHLTLSSLTRWAVLRALYSVESSTGSWGPDDITSASQLATKSGSVRRAFTSLFGRLLTERRFLKAGRLITRTTTRSTTCLLTWSVYRATCIAGSLRTATARQIRGTSEGPTTWARGPGTPLRRAASGIARTLSSAASAIGSIAESVCAAALRSSVETQGRSFALNAAATQRAAHVEATFGSVCNAVRGLSPRTTASNAALVSAAVVGEPQIGSSVYNLRVEDAQCFYANGVLVHNCNSLAGCILEADERGRNKMPPKIEEKPAQDFNELMRRERRDLLKAQEGGGQAQTRRSMYRRGRH